MIKQVLNEPDLTGDLKTARFITTNLLGAINWVSPVTGFARCPGESEHTNPTKERDCIVFIDQIPTIHCLHESCGAEVVRINTVLRRRLGTFHIRPFGDWQSKRKLRATQIDREVKSGSLLKGAAEDAYKLIEGKTIQLEEFKATSPTGLPTNPREHWRSLLQLFKPSDFVWIRKGGFEPGLFFTERFDYVSQWLRHSMAPGQLTCPNTFVPGSFRRTNANIQHYRYLVVESDNLTKPEVLSVFQWLRREMRLRAVVDTGNKSLHGWFDYPKASLIEELRVILPVFKCDTRMMTPSQPCRLPGAQRSEKLQSLVWLDLGGAR